MNSWMESFAMRSICVIVCLAFVALHGSCHQQSGGDEASQPSLIQQLQWNSQSGPNPYMVFPSINKQKLQEECQGDDCATLSNSSNHTQKQIGSLYGRSYARLFGLLPLFVQDIIVFLLDNLFVGVVGLGTLLTLCRQGVNKLYFRFWDTCTATLEVSSDQQTYIWLSNWLSLKDWGYCQHVTGIISPSQQQNFDCDGDDDAGPEGAPRFRLVPNLQKYGFFYNGQWIAINKTKKQDKEKEGKSGGFQSDRGTLFGHVLTLSTVGTRDVTIFRKVLDEARQHYIQQTKVGMQIWVAKGNYWDQLGSGSVRKRSLDSVILDEGVMEALLKDIKLFISDRKWYENTGVPYRRGYLLYGPPGCGKTSIISALAGFLDYGVSIMSLSDKFMDDESLRQLMNTIPQRSILLLEDIDAAFPSREKNSQSKTEDLGALLSTSASANSSITFSGLLNALDGVASADARILFMTTNYVDRLDPALVRPGRVDYKQKISYCSEYQTDKMFRRFFPDVDEAQISVFLDGLKHPMAEEEAGTSSGHLPNLSPAQLQGYLLVNRIDPQGAIDGIQEFLEESKKENDNFTDTKRGLKRLTNEVDRESSTSGVGRSRSRSRSPVQRQPIRRPPPRFNRGRGRGRRRY